MFRPERMTFGVFLAPFHPTNENPTLAFERDLELLEWLDALGYDEAFIGEHHSAGWETIASPEVFIAAAAPRTRYIRFGTGVVSIPYHHPFMVADRMVLLDHLTRGRVILGVGPGALASDAYMMGVDPARQREMMDEGLGVIKRLFTETEPFTVKSDWFELNDGMLQIRPYQHPSIPLVVASVQTPAGRDGGGQARRRRDLAEHAARAGARDIAGRAVVDRRGDRRRARQRDAARGLAALDPGPPRRQPRSEAMEDVRRGHRNVTREYFEKTLGHAGPDVSDDSLLEYVMERHGVIVGTPDDMIEAIDRLHEISGGFGGMLVARRGLGAAREDPPQLRAAGALRDAALPGQRRAAPGLQPVGAGEPRADPRPPRARRPHGHRGLLRGQLLRRRLLACPRGHPLPPSPLPEGEGEGEGRPRPGRRALPRPGCCARMPGARAAAWADRARAPMTRGLNGRQAGR